MVGVGRGLLDTDRDKEEEGEPFPDPESLGDREDTKELEGCVEGDTLGVELPRTLPVPPSLLRVTLGVFKGEDDKEAETEGLVRGVGVAPLKDTVG
jgi:hypothetical protein